MKQDTNDNSSKARNDSEKEQDEVSSPQGPSQLVSTTVEDIIGQFGFYQLSLSILTFLRYFCVAMMTNTGPLIAPDVDFSCHLDNKTSNFVKIAANETLSEYLKKRCILDLMDGTRKDCTSWTFNTTKYGVTLTDSFELVCDRDWWRSALQSTISCGVLLASLVGGSFSDTNGRGFTIRVAFLGSLIAGLISYWCNNFIVYSISRALCTFGDLSLVVSLATIIVESVGNKYRGAVCIIVYTGWALAVMIMPWLTDYFRDYRQLMLFTVVCHIITFPWILTIKESVRWLLVNGFIEEARAELKRISWWNGKGDEQSLGEVDKKFNMLKLRFMKNQEARTLKSASKENPSLGTRCKGCLFMLFGGLSGVKKLFQQGDMTATTLTALLVVFTSELFYMLTILMNSDLGEDIKLNYAIGGLMELAATASSIIMIAKLTRRVSLITTMVLISNFCTLLAIYNGNPTLSTIILNVLKFVVSALSSVVFVITTEIFPTSMRQTGLGLCGVIGSLGAALAPFVRTELVDAIGMEVTLIMVAMLPLAAGLIVPFYLKETKGIELSDDLDDLDKEAPDDAIVQYDRHTDKVHVNA